MKSIAHGSYLLVIFHFTRLFGESPTLQATLKEDEIDPTTPTLGKFGVPNTLKPEYNFPKTNNINNNNILCLRTENVKRKRSSHSSYNSLNSSFTRTLLDLTMMMTKRTTTIMVTLQRLVFSLFIAMMMSSHHGSTTLVSALTNVTLNHGLAPTTIYKENRFAFGMVVVGILAVLGLFGWFAWYRSRRSQYETVSTEATA